MGKKISRKGKGDMLTVAKKSYIYKVYKILYNISRENCIKRYKNKTKLCKIIRRFIKGGILYMKKGIRKTISVIAILTMTFQMGMPMIPAFQTKALAADMTIPAETEKIEATVSEDATTDLSENTDTTETEEISRNYQIKDEETWDISENGDGSVIAKWTLDDRTLTISGTGEMKDWKSDSVEDWHDTQYTNLIQKAIIEEGVTYIGNYAFEECSSLTSIEIPEGVTSIGSSTFRGCSSLESINNIPSSVTSIGDSAFYGCSSLESMNILEGVTSIGNSAFRGCNSLESINVDENNTNYISENGILFNKEKTNIICYPAEKKDIRVYYSEQYNEYRRFCILWM